VALVELLTCKVRLEDQGSPKVHLLVPTVRLGHCKLRAMDRGNAQIPSFKAGWRLRLIHGRR
jgi:hypothetical protein